MLLFWGLCQWILILKQECWVLFFFFLFLKKLHFLFYLWGGERERSINLWLHLFMHSLRDSCTCPDQGLKPQYPGDVLIHWATWPALSTIFQINILYTCGISQKTSILLFLKCNIKNLIQIHFGGIYHGESKNTSYDTMKSQQKGHSM